jgi:2-C-methyl-D-erythritol 4-phosphate cytidylyltransferase/2-C-methyl-D-erythritol 2,4-cyclodiphosphate synthase
VQTPQVFRRSLLEEAHRAAAAAGVTGTDDASLVERLGHRVKVVVGEVNNFKVTTPEDVARAEAFLRQRAIAAGRRCEAGAGIEGVMDSRTGLGYDAHRFAPGRRLMLGGVEFPHEDGLLGHSDADVVCHAISDALLGASAAGDIGQHFPDTDPRYAGVSSVSLLARVGELVRGRGWRLGHVDVVVVAEQPRLAPRLEEMRRALASALETEVERVSIKGKTTDGKGFTGRREGIACYAVCTLHRAEASEGPE